MNNPFSISFGKKPEQYISRITQTNEIVEMFSQEVINNQVYLLTGVRGSGKTVLLTNVQKILSENEDFICIELNPLRDMLQSMAAKLYDIPLLRTHFVKAKLDLSALGIGLSIEGAAPVNDIETAIDIMLKTVKKLNKRVLIAVDEAINSENIRIFTTAFQIMIRNEAPVFLLMTGLYENIYELQNNKALTFMYRAPKIVLEPLNFTAVRAKYASVFNFSLDKAEKMAIMTKGYPFAFQTLGYLMWENKGSELQDILNDYDQYLSEYVYSKIWSETSDIDKKVLEAMSTTDSNSVQKIREKLGMSAEKFSVYRERLLRKGVVSSQGYGNISLSLPRFAEFVQNRMAEFR